MLMGYLGVATAVKHLRGEKVEKRIDTGVVLVTRENMEQQEIQGPAVSSIGQISEVNKQPKKGLERVRLVTATGARPSPAQQCLQVVRHTDFSSPPSNRKSCCARGRARSASDICAVTVSRCTRLEFRHDKKAAGFPQYSQHPRSIPWVVAGYRLFSLNSTVRRTSLVRQFKLILTQTVIVAISALGMTMIIVSGGSI